jgi:large subunit ribosomal protein L30
VLFLSALLPLKDLLIFLNHQTQKIEIKLIKSAIGYNRKKKNTLKALGLTKMNKVVIKNKNNAIAGMIKQVFHLVEV